MKTFLQYFSLVLLVLYPFSNGFSQDGCCIEVDRPEPGFWLNDPLNLCFLDDEEECFSMRAPSVSGAIPGCPTSQLQNSHTYILFPNSNDFTLQIESGNCSNGDGIQVALYKLIADKYVDDCLELITIFDRDLSYEQTFCTGSMGLIEFTQSDARDNIFYLIIDGFQGDRCDYVIRSLAGTYKSAPRDSIILSGPAGMPEGYTGNYTAERFQFDCFRQYDCQCGECGLDTFDVTWTGPPGSIVTPIPGTLSADVTMGPQSGSVCIMIRDDCVNLLSCVFVELTPPEYYQKCPADDVMAHGNTYPDPGIYYPEEDGYIYEVEVDNFVEEVVVEFFDGCIGDEFLNCFFNPITYPQTYDLCYRILNDTCRTTEINITWHETYDILLNDTICSGESYIFCNDTFYDPTSITCNLQTTFGCDSVVRLTLVVLDADTIQLVDTLCAGTQIEFCEELISSTGIYSCSDTMTGGCVQVTVLNLFTLPIDSFYIDTLLCAGDTLAYGGSLLFNSGTYVFENVDLNLCLTREIVTLSLIENDTTFILDTICDIEPYDFCGILITDPGTYYCSHSVDGPCDSIVALTLVTPCQATDLVVLCAGDSLFLTDTVLTVEGTYLIEIPYSDNCTCLSTITLDYIDLGTTQLVSSNELDCSNGFTELSVDWDLSITPNIEELSWIFENQIIGQNLTIEVAESGFYALEILYSDFLAEMCSDTLYLEVLGETLFEPSIEWINRDLYLCDSSQSQYLLEFVTDAPHSTLILLNTDESWEDQSSLIIDVPSGSSIFSFQLILSDEMETCEVIHEFDVEILDLGTTWPDTVYINSQEINSQLNNPLFTFEGEVENINISPSDAVDFNINSELIVINPSASGPLNVSFEIGDCSYQYATWIIRNSIFIPNAFSPNNDGINDRFSCFTSSGLQLTELSIFNRWGGKVFSTTQGPYSWNGRSNDKYLPQGMYVVQYRYIDGNGKEYAGISELLLLR